jgi:hypothetical protein
LIAPAPSNPPVTPTTCLPPPRQEDEQLVKGYRRWGNSWTKIAAMIGGRTDNAVKNRFTSLSEAVRGAPCVLVL